MNIAEKIHVLHRAWRYRLREEKKSVEYLLDQNLTDCTVIDIGANKGVYTYWMSKKVGKNGRVISFEPQPELGEFLTDLRRSFKLNNVKIVNKGLSDKSGSFTLTRGKVGSGGAQLKAEGVKPLRATHEVTVDVTTLDDFLQNEAVGDIKFIKCDVEGHELAVFRGAEKAIRQHHPTLLFECHHQAAQEGHLFSYLEHLGYVGFFFVKDQPVSTDEFDQYPYQRASNTHRNYIFIYKKQR